MFALLFFAICNSVATIVCWRALRGSAHAGGVDGHESFRLKVFVKVYWNIFSDLRTAIVATLGAQFAGTQAAVLVD